VHPLSKYIGDNAASRQAVMPSLRVAAFGKCPKEDVTRSVEAVSVEEIKAESPEMPCQNTGSAVE
jgi:hypothetical protein